MSEDGAFARSIIIIYNYNLITKMGIVMDLSFSDVFKTSLMYVDETLRFVYSIYYSKISKIINLRTHLSSFSGSQNTSQFRGGVMLENGWK